MCECCKKGTPAHRITKADGQVAFYCPVCYLVLAFTPKHDFNKIHVNPKMGLTSSVNPAMVLS